MQFTICELCQKNWASRGEIFIIVFINFLEFKSTYLLSPQGMLSLFTKDGQEVFGFTSTIDQFGMSLEKRQTD